MSFVNSIQILTRNLRKLKTSSDIKCLPHILGNLNYELNNKYSNLNNYNLKRDIIKYLESKSDNKLNTINKIKNLDNHYFLNKSDFVDTIKFNKFGYNKHILVTNDLLTCFLVTWNKGACTDIHGHPSKGCYVLKLCGNWEEDLYKDDKLIDISNLTGGNIRYINNSMGYHRMRYLDDQIGFSINIYTPTKEIVNFD